MGEDRKVEWHHALRSGIGFSLSNLIYMAQGVTMISRNSMNCVIGLGFKSVVYVAENVSSVYLLGGSGLSSNGYSNGRKGVEIDNL